MSIFERIRHDQTPKPKHNLESSQNLVVENPIIKSATTLKFSLPEREGRELPPGKAMTFRIPKEFRNRIVRDVVLQHRKAEKYRVDGTEKWDPHGAYSRVELHDAQSGEWMGWRDPSGYNPDKYAEWRASSDPEHEVLHDWLATVGEIRPDEIRVTNVGQHETYSTSQIHDLEVIFYPESSSTHYQERIYTPGTSFIDIEQKKLLPKYGGGESTRGIYAKAIVLNGSAPDFPITKDPGAGAHLESGRLMLDLEPGKRLIQIEVAIGDTENRGKGDVRLGWAKLWVGIKRAADQRIEWCIEHANVPPQGVIAGGPSRPIIEPGDKLVIESRADTSYLMGWRLAYGEESSIAELY